MPLPGLSQAADRPLVSIVCVTHGRRAHVLRCLESCVRQDYAPLEIIVFVNGSDLETERAIASSFPNVRRLTAQRNVGFFPALNLAIADARGEFIMTVDDDAWFMSPDAIGRLVAAFEREPGLGAVTCNLEGPSERPVEGGDRYVHLFTTGFTMMPRRVFTEWIGYYPDLFFRSAGETFMCTALWDQDRPVKRVHNVRMFHARTMDARPTAEWYYHGLRSQILCGLMRDPWYLVPAGLVSKASRSFVHGARLGMLSTWCRAWAGAARHTPAALRLRRPISWKTQRRLWRLRGGGITDLSVLRPH